MKTINYKSLVFLLVNIAINAECPTNEIVCVDIKKNEFERIINQNNDLPALLLSLKILGDYAQSKAQTLPFHNLCTFASRRHRSFCQYNKGISRIDMPQIEGQPKPGSKAERMITLGILIPAKNGNVDLKDQFIIAMDKKFGPAQYETVDASTLKSTQNEINGCYVACMWWTLKQNPTQEQLRAPLFVSKDNYILDGHHRWAALDALEYGAQEIKPVMMRVIRINTDIDTLLKEALQFVQEYGIKAQSIL